MSTSAARRSAPYAVLLLIVLSPLVLSQFRVFQLTLVGIWAIAILGLNLVTGLSGQVSLGHGAFFGAGAYTAAILANTRLGNLGTVLLVGGLVGGLGGVLFGFPALRLRGQYLAVVTLSLIISFQPLVKRMDSLTGGVAGIGTEGLGAAPSWLPLSRVQWHLYLVLLVGLVLFRFSKNLKEGRVGRALLAIRDGELGAQTLGINAARYKVYVFGWSTAFAGVAGALFAIVLGHVAPDNFTLVLSIGMLVGAVIGGLQSMLGPVVGGLFLQFVPAWATDIDPGLGSVIFGAVIIVVMALMPTGVVGLIQARMAAVSVSLPRGVGPVLKVARPSGGRQKRSIPLVAQEVEES